MKVKTIEEIQHENDKIVFDFTQKIWDELSELTKDYSDKRQYMIFSRVTAFMCANVYLPMVTRASSDCLAKESFT